ncbi:hypothetical protein IWX47DRAFT_81391 [Phyllosticta citricarpa]
MAPQHHREHIGCICTSFLFVASLLATDFASQDGDWAWSFFAFLLFFFFFFFFLSTSLHFAFDNHGMDQVMASRDRRMVGPEWSCRL